MLDFDGDGRTDLMRLVDGSWRVLRSVGTNFQLIDTGVTQHGLQLADVNGDGLQDAVVNSVGKWAIRLNLGGSFGGLIPTTHSATNLDYAQVIDFNSDGRQDLFVPFDGAWHVLRATPTGTNFDLLRSLISVDGYDNGPQTGDFNGDGLVDLALDYGATWHLHFHKPGNSGLISAIDAGGEQFDDRIVINYRPLTDSSSLTLESINYDFPWPRPSFTSFYKLTVADRLPCGVACNTRGLMAPIYVTESYRKSNGVAGTREYAYTYENAQVNIAGRGYLGFGKMTVRDVRDLDDNSDDIYTVSTYRQQFPFTGVPAKTEVHHAGIDSSPLSEVSNVYDEAATIGGATNPYLKSSVQKSYDLNSGALLATTTTDMGQPSTYGNTREISVQVTDASGTHSTNTSNTYADHPTAWRLGRLLRSQVTHTNSGGESRTRVSSFEYASGTDLLNKEIVQSGTAFELIKTYGRDAFGNITVEAVSGADIATRRTTTEYNAPRGRFPETITTRRITPKRTFMTFITAAFEASPALTI